MSVRAIVDLELNDAAWTKFQAQYKAYETALAGNPAAWKKVTDEIDGSRKSFDELVGAAGERQVRAKLNAEAEKVAAEQLKRQSGETTTQARSWSAMARDSKNFAANVVKATTSLLRWAEVTAAISGLLGAGGLFGIDRLAQGVASQRKDASGIRVTPGELRSFGLNFNRLLDNPAGFLGSVSESLSDVTKAAPYGALGLNYGRERNKPPADVAIDVLRAEKRLADQTPQSQLGNVFSSRQLAMLGTTLEDFQRIKDRPLAELEEYFKHNQADRRDLDLTKDQQRAWEDLKVQLGRAGNEIEKTFVVGLTKLAEPLGHLSAGFVKVVEAFAASDQLKAFIDEAASGLERFATYIGTPQFGQDVKDFVDGIGAMAHKIADALKWLGIIPDADAKPADKPAPRPELGPADKMLPTPGERPFWALPPGQKPYFQPFKKDAPGSSGGSFHDYDNVFPGAYRPSAGPSPVVTGNRVREAHDFFRAAGWSEAQTAGILGNIGTESGFKPEAFNPAGGGQGAQGIAQWRGSRITDFQRLFGHDPRHGTYEEQLAFVQWELTHSERAAAERLRAARSAGQAGAAVNESYERSGTNSRARSRAAEQYGSQFKDRSVRVQIENQTGGNANVTVAQMAV